MKFKSLSVEKRLNVVEKLFSFFETFIDCGYVSVDFYDSSIMYDFKNDKVTFCDIDLFRKMPTSNDLGKDYLGNIDERYENGMFIPNNIEKFELSKEIYNILIKATSYDRNNRYSSVKEFHKEFINKIYEEVI